MQVRRHHHADAAAEQQISQPTGRARAGGWRPEVAVPAVADACLPGVANDTRWLECCSSADVHVGTTV